MTTRREAIMTAATALGAAICDALDLSEAVPDEPTPAPAPVPAEPIQYGAIIEPEAPVLEGVEKVVFGVQMRKTDGDSIDIANRWWADKYMGYRASARLAYVNCEDIMLHNYGPMIVMRGCDDIYINRVWSLDARHSETYGIGILRATDTLGKIRVTNTKFVGSEPLPNSGDPRAVFCLQGKDGDDVCTDWELSRFHYENCVMLPKLNEDGSVASDSRYLNVDGISIERGHDDGVIEHGFIDNCSDAGIDCKGHNVLINQVDIANCRQSLKLWDTSERYGRIISRTPRFAHILAASSSQQVEGERIVIDRLECPDAPTKPVVAFEGRKDVVIRTLIAPEGQKLFTKTNDADGSTLWVNGTQVL